MGTSAAHPRSTPPGFGRVFNSSTLDGRFKLEDREKSGTERVGRAPLQPKHLNLETLAVSHLDLVLWLGTPSISPYSEAL